MTDVALEGRAQELRRLFDRTFSNPPPPPAAATVDLLAITLAGQPFALRLAEVAGLFADRPITPLPARVTGLLGLIGSRGAVLPTYDLRVFLGHAAATKPPRWIVVAREQPVALAFDALDGHRRVAALAIADSAPGHGIHTPALVHLPELRPIVALSSVLATIRLAGGARDLSQEPNHDVPK
jgi:chemotaxis signal transduction protein